ncbi:hypothetical protein LWI29_024852 [Acer saccharum]|uniref:Tf2-1-like SH3-like domain-containing protein n=1 Tax=Acer saccharum TaxID=4024 RepID=A0AA39T7E9_ACESA|nr:hypothetical protein LWI29_024852 [Acer saccharum]
MNVISKAVVERLDLPQQPHPTPYRVSWINDTSTVPVQHRCLVKFSLGANYSDEVWCDVLPMTVCHLLLGRPWLYDRRVLYNGYENSYSFIFQKRKITLQPFPIADFGPHYDDKSQKVQKVTNSVLTLRQVDRELQARFESMKEQYALDSNFKDIWYSLQNTTTPNHAGFTLKDGYLTKHSRQLPLPTNVSEARLDFFSHMSTLHDDIRRKIATNTADYAAHANKKKRDVQFSVGEMVLIRLRFERFPPGSFPKLHARRAGPFPILKKLGPNAYLVDLPSDYGFSPIFSVEDLTKFEGMDELDIRPSDSTPRVPLVPQTRDAINAILDHQFVSTRRGGYYKFLARWATKPISKAVWLQAPEVQRLHPELLNNYLQQHLPESNSKGGGN